MTHRVRFLPGEIIIEVEDGENLLKAAMKAGVHINASCGGGGVCGKCRVILEKGELDSPKTEHIRLDEYDEGNIRQACKSWVKGDVDVRIPIESQMSADALNRARPDRNASRSAREIGVERLQSENIFHPPNVKLRVEVDPPAHGNNISDLTRLINALRSQYDVHNLRVDFRAIQHLPRVIRERGFGATVTLVYPPSYAEEGEKESAQIVLRDIQPGDHDGSHYGLAVDVGTTTVWVQLLDMRTGEVLDTAADFNKQLSYGEDVITRIMYTQKENGLHKMQELAAKTINGLIEQICSRKRIDPDNITLVTAAGNTTMTQLMLGVDPRYIRLAPYVPTANFYPPVRARDVGLEVPEHVMLNVFPAVSSYVGGDIVAGVLASDMYREPELTLFIDMGTNGEIVVGNRDWMACASCSAGPAFEGGGVKFGMRATAGAIEEFAINPDTLEPMLLTVDMKKPKGICGSGIINIVAGLFEAGVIDERGKFERELNTNRVREGEDGWEYVLSWAGENQVGRDIVLTEVDIDNLIRAKAAMYAGVQTLMEGVGLSMHDLDRVIIAGGFGKYINLEKSIMIGLLPELDLEKYRFIGNGSLIGARLATLSNELRYDARQIQGRITNFELSEVPAYMDYYVSCQFLPHTDRNKFPNTAARMAQTRPLINKLKRG